MDCFVPDLDRVGGILCVYQCHVEIAAHVALDFA